MFDLHLFYKIVLIDSPHLGGNKKKIWILILCFLLYPGYPGTGTMIHDLPGTKHVK